MQIHMFIAHMAVGGAERVCVNLANEFVDRGHEVNLVVLDLKNDVNTHLLDEKVKVHVLGVSRLRYSIFPMWKYLKKNKPKFMFVFGLEMAVIINKLKKLGLSDTKIVVRILNNVNISLAKEDNVSPIVENYLNSAQSQLADMSHVIAQCKAMGDMVIKKGLVKEDMLSVVYNPVSEALTKKVGNIRKSLSKEEKRELVFIGRIDPQKQPDKLIETFRIVHEKMPETMLRIVGDGNLFNQTREQVIALGLEKNVIFDGVRKDMENVYSKAAVVILSSAYEGMPNSLIEAIGCGIPVVSFDCPIGPAEIVEDGVNGFLVPTDDIEKLADQVCLALTQSWDEDIIKATCRKFDVKNIACEYEKIFEKVTY